MGVSTDAILFYGYCWDEEIQLIASDGDWEDIILKKRGRQNPWELAPDWDRMDLGYDEKRRFMDPWIALNRDKLDHWYELKKTIREEFPVDIHYHCSGDCPIPYIAAYRLVATRGNPVHMTLPAIDPAWAKNLDRFLEEFSISRPQPQPAWWLVSNWA